MSELKRHEIRAGQERREVDLSLWQMPNPRGVPVLLLHGASANSATFLNPKGLGPDGEPRCLAEWLLAQGYEPWLLDWRGNGLQPLGVLSEFRDQLDFDGTADFDIPKALEHIHRVSPTRQIAAVGHCMGAATLAQSIAGGKIEKSHKLTHVVLLAIGLFYEASPTGKLKSMDGVLEELWIKRRNLFAIDPRPNNRWPNEWWPAEIENLYYNFPEVRPHPKPTSEIDEMCNRVSFMFGKPYREANLHPEVHLEHYLPTQFGSIPFRMYLQGARNVGRRWAGRFDAKSDDSELVDDPAKRKFRDLERVTLLTGAKNDIWQRDSIDRMYDWLGPGNCQKEILLDYAHQDLLWGATAHRDVFPEIREGLPPPKR